MHPSSRENMQKCLDRYLWNSELLEHDGELVVLDVGGADVNGSYADMFRGDRFSYLGADLNPGPGVSVVMTDTLTVPLEDQSVDIVLSGQMLEHCANFWIVFGEMVRVLKKDGYLFLIAPSAGPIHRYPVDCYRFYPDAYAALAEYARCHLVDCWLDDRGPWNDLVGVFSRIPRPKVEVSRREFSPAIEINSFTDAGSNEADLTGGSTPYLEMLQHLHRSLQPRSYLEIGVRNGRSLALADCPAVGVDPYPEVTVPLGNDARIVEQTSDEFFESAEDPVLSTRPDLVFIDGMHTFEHVLRDFINVEAICDPSTVVVVDDVFPNTPQQAQRERITRVWTGDVWKLVPVLREHRPNLKLTLLDTHPTGMLVVSGLDPGNRVLRNRYNPIMSRFGQGGSVEVPASVIEREGAIDPERFDIGELVPSGGRGPGAVGAREPRSPVRSRRSTVPEPRISVVVASYNMSRELPRTLWTLRHQRGMAGGEAEVIVVDNGSTDDVDLQALESSGPDIRVLRVDSGSPSPVEAINRGLSEARAPLRGVMIDGARMASPGLLSAALDAAALHPRAVVGTIAFHLGPKVQMISVKEGYDQDEEDRLLAGVPWQEDGYSLFSVSVLAGSSAGGWLRIPAETNAVFMEASMWVELGGYDPAFQSPGGGYVNLDTWKRAAELPDAQVVMLLGEATFHQVHGGVATNNTDPSEDQQEKFKEEYRRIRGVAYEIPGVRPVFHGTFHHGGPRFDRPA